MGSENASMVSTATVKPNTSRDDLSTVIHSNVTKCTDAMSKTGDTEAISYIAGNTTYQVLNKVEDLSKDDDEKPNGLPTQMHLSLHFTGRVDGTSPSLTVAGFYGDLGSRLQAFTLTVNGTGRGTIRDAE